MNKLQTEIQHKITDIFNQTDKKYFDTKLLTHSFSEIQKVLVHMGLKWRTMVISGHGFKPEYQDQYNAEAKINIPQIYFGEEGLSPARVGGGVAYVIARK